MRDLPQCSTYQHLSRTLSCKIRKWMHKVLQPSKGRGDSLLDLAENCALARLVLGLD